jgi:hypothetical protein
MDFAATVFRRPGGEARKVFLLGKKIGRRDADALC